jgi:sulfur relay protein TusB/DsrH
MREATKKLVVLRSGPGTAAVGLRSAAEMARQGERVSLCLIQDGVLCALKGNQGPSETWLAEAVEAGVELRYLEEDLAARGFGRGDVRAEATPLGYGELAELMLADGQRVLGAF